MATAAMQMRVWVGSAGRHGGMAMGTVAVLVEVENCPPQRTLLVPPLQPLPRATPLPPPAFTTPMATAAMQMRVWVGSAGLCIYIPFAVFLSLPPSC